jgi:hypothetical protein
VYVEQQRTTVLNETVRARLSRGILNDLEAEIDAKEKTQGHACSLSHRAVQPPMRVVDIVDDSYHRPHWSRPGQNKFVLVSNVTTSVSAAALMSSEGGES